MNKNSNYQQSKNLLKCKTCEGQLDRGAFHLHLLPRDMVLYQRLLVPVGAQTSTNSELKKD